MTRPSSRGHWLYPGFVAIALLALAACSTASGASTFNSASTPPLPAASDVLSQAEHAALKDASFVLTQQQGAIGAQSGTGTLTTSPQRQQTLIADFGDVSSYTVGRFTEFAGAQTFYVKYPSKADWFPAQPSDIFANDGVQGIVFFVEFADYSHLQAVKVIGSETVGGAPTWHLRATLPLTGILQQAATKFNLKGDTATEDLWLRQGDAYPVKLVYVFPGSGATSNLTMTLTFKSWDSGLTLPIPPKPVPVG